MFLCASQKAFLLLKRFLLPLLIFLGFFLLFQISVAQTSHQALTEEKSSLEDAIIRGAVHSYALNGFYPQNLSELLKEYHITYDTNQFLVEYVPNGTNLLPSVSVLNKAKGGNLP